STALFPQVAAGKTGRLAVAYYGASASTVWFLFMLGSNDGGADWDVQQVPGAVHTGTVCTDGAACGLPARDLFDCFGIAFDPSTQRATAVYTTDGGTDDPTQDYSAYATEVH